MDLSETVHILVKDDWIFESYGNTQIAQWPKLLTVVRYILRSFRQAISLQEKTVRKKTKTKLSIQKIFSGLSFRGLSF